MTDADLPATTPHPPRPAWFLSLTVENVRCFGPKQTLDLSDGHGRPAPWTVLLGENGTGKTTLLQWLATVPSLMEKNSGEARLSNGAGDHTRVFWLSAGRSWINSLTGANGQWSVSAEIAAIEEGEARVLKQAISHGRVGATGLIDQAGFETGTTLDECMMACFGYGANRVAGRPHLAFSDHEFLPERLRSLFCDIAPLRDVENWLLKTDYAELKRGQTDGSASTLQRVIDLLKRVLPGVRNIEIRPGRARTASPTVQFLTDYGWVEFSQLGIGYRSMAAWTVDMASRMVEVFPDSPDPLAEPVVCLVDEIDLHLHPRWQRQIKSHLLKVFPNTQFVVTAYSPLIVQSSLDENIALLRRVGDHVVIDNDPTVVRGWRLDQILTSDLFGLESARPPDYENLLNERRQLMMQADLSHVDQARLGELDRLISDLPVGESDADREAMDLIRRAAARLKRMAGADS